mmetsp:Transcript_22289/g.63977  ORF Transcript_22289/g.63977 Transcript_22289/m.63977 type:complete len:298 (+) Transcript_22289:237-1130(+)
MSRRRRCGGVLAPAMGEAGGRGRLSTAWPPCCRGHYAHGERQDRRVLTDRGRFLQWHRGLFARLSAGCCRQPMGVGLVPRGGGETRSRSGAMHDVRSRGAARRRGGRDAGGVVSSDPRPFPAHRLRRGPAHAAEGRLAADADVFLRRHQGAHRHRYDRFRCSLVRRFNVGGVRVQGLNARRIGCRPQPLGSGGLRLRRCGAHWTPGVRRRSRLGELHFGRCRTLPGAPRLPLPAGPGDARPRRGRRRPYREEGAVASGERRGGCPPLAGRCCPHLRAARGRRRGVARRFGAARGRLR